MSSSNNRFGRRTGGQSDNLRSEPSLSFNPKRPGARDKQSDAEPPVTRTPPAAPRVDRADAVEFGARSGRDAQRDPIPSFMRGSGPGPRVDRDDAEEFGMSHDDDGRHDEDFDPRRAPREKAMEPQIPAADRPLYHHLFDEDEKRGHGFGWAAALGSVVILVVGAAYAWHNFMARPAPGNLFEPPSVAARGPDSGYTTPTQPATNADGGLDNASTGSTPSPLTSTPPDTTPPTRDVAVAPQPKDVPAAPPAPPKRTIAEAAANPGNLGPPVTPPTAVQPAVAPAPILTPPAPKHETPKREAPRKEAAITPPKPAPAPVHHDTAQHDRAQHDTAPQDAPPAVTQPAAAPAVSAPPPRRHEPQATGQPEQLNRTAPAAYPPPQQQPQQQQPNFATRAPPPANFAPDNSGHNNAAPANAAPQPGSPDTVTVDGVTYVNGQEPHALGTLGNQPPAASDAPMPPGVPSLPAPSRPSTRYYAPADRDGGAPLPNDVIILPNGQMAVPNGQQ
ncbi:MAG TPA: hypothetical protein VHX19_23490 [Stellaceae bacterium]|nr:hypothetical protein [Stellaceae bacterium]